MLNNQKSPFKQKFRFFFTSHRYFCFILLISCFFSLQIFSWISNVLVNYRFASIFSLLFAYSPFVSLQIFAVSLRCETSGIRNFFASKRNEIFAPISIFLLKQKMRAHPTPNAIYVTLPFIRRPQVQIRAA